MYARQALCHQGHTLSSITCRFLSHYNVIGVEKTATKAELKSAYFAKTKTCHPDLFPGDKKKSEQFLKLQEAYEVLGDETKRRQYDRTGGAPSQQPSSRPYQQPYQKPYQHPHQQQNYDPFRPRTRSRTRNRTTNTSEKDWQDFRQHQDFHEFIKRAHEHRKERSRARERHSRVSTLSTINILKLTVVFWLLTRVLIPAVLFTPPTEDFDKGLEDREGETNDDSNDNYYVHQEDQEQMQTSMRLKRRMEELKRQRDLELTDQLHDQAQKQFKHEQMRLYEERHGKEKTG